MTYTTHTLAAGGNPTMWLLILVVILLLFGAKRIPEMMRGLGSGLREFRKAMENEVSPRAEGETSNEEHAQR